MIPNATTTTTAAPDSSSHTAPVTLLKKVDYVTYKVKVHFSRTNKETLEDKVRKLIEREVNCID